MLWEIEIRPKAGDAERDRVGDEFDLLTHTPADADRRGPRAASSSKAT